MCDCFHLAFPNWHASQGAGRRLGGPETGAEDESICDEPSHVEGERPRPQGSSPVEEYPEKYADSDREGDAEHESPHKRGSGKKIKKAGLGSLFDKRSTPKMSKLKEVHSPESGAILSIAEDGCADGLVVGGGGKDGIFIKQVVPESPAAKNLSVKEGDQILSATVYFDNVTYEDALQILEHAQAYKVKLCLKRQPELSESEPVIQPDVINEEEGSPVMRRQGKTKRQSNARISWPKFSSFGKGQKKHFTRSHSSSEADEQRKLELSPTTSDTESPIKTQEALKGKKKHKVKLSCLKKRGSVSTPPDQDQGVSDINSPEHPASTLVDSTHKAENLDVKETSDMKDQKLTGPETPQHKVELISLDSTLKTTDLTVALSDQKHSPAKESPDGTKSKKKERSDLKVRIMGKDKSQKQEQQVKSSPKRLKTLGASMERTEPTENKTSESSAVPSANTGPSDMEINMPKVDLSLDMSDLGLLKKSPKRGKEKKDTNIFQQPNVSLSGITTEDTITSVMEDPYAKLSKAQLPKREDIEIPGMEDTSTKMTKSKGFKEPSPIYTGQAEETVQMAIDVDSVREAVSKLPGFKLPKVDTSGMLIPEEITMIDANAQRITVKTPAGTPTKVVDSKTKQDAHFTSDIKASSDILSCKSVKLPKSRHEDLTYQEVIVETKVEKKVIEATEKTLETGGLHDQAVNLAVVSPDGTDKKSKKAKLTMPSLGISKPDIRFPDIGIDLPKRNVSEQKEDYEKDDQINQDLQKSITETGLIQVPDIDKVKGPEIDLSLSKKDLEYTLPEVNSEIKLPEADVKASASISMPEAPGLDVDAKFKKPKFSMPRFSFAKPSIKSPEADVNLPEADASLPEHKVEMKSPEMEIKPPETEVQVKNVEGSPAKFKMPTFKLPKFGSSASNVTVEVPEMEKIDGADVKFPTGEAEISAPSIESEGPSVHVKTTDEFEGKGKFKMPSVGVSIPKVKGPSIDLTLSNKDVDVTLAEKHPEIKVKEPLAKVDVKGPEVALQVKDFEGSPSKFKMPTFKMPKFGVGPNVDAPAMEKVIQIDGSDLKIPEVEAEIATSVACIDTGGQYGDATITGTEFEGKGSKFKMPSVGISMPKVKGPEIDFNLSKKDIDVNIPKSDVSMPEGKVEVKEPIVEIKAPETELEIEGQGSKFKMPKFGISLPKVKGPEIDFSLSKKDVDATIPEATSEVKPSDVEIKGPSAKVEIEAPEFDVQLKNVEGSPSKFKMPTFKLPKFGANVTVEVPEVEKEINIEETPDVGAGVDTTLPEVKVEAKIPDVEVKEPSASISTELDAKLKRPRFSLPKFSFSKQSIPVPEVDINAPDADVTLPETKEVKIPDVDVNIEFPQLDVKLPEVKTEVHLPVVAMKEPGISIEDSTAAELDAKLKKPRFSLPRFSFSKQSGQAPEIDVNVPKAEILLPEGHVEMKEPEMEMKAPESELEIEGQGSKFKMPSFGISMPKIKAPEIDLSLQKKEVGVILPEVKAEVKTPDIEVKDASAQIVLPDVPTLESDDKGRKTSWSMPRFSFSKPNIKGPEVDINFETPQIDVTIPEAKTEIDIPEVEVKEPTADISIEGPEIVADLDAKLKKPRFSLPRFSFSKQSVQAPEVDVDVPKVDVDIPEGKIEMKEPDIEIKGPGGELAIEGQGSKFKMPSLGISMPKVKGPEIDSSLQKKDVTLPGIKAEVKVPDIEAIEPSAAIAVPDAPKLEDDGKGRKTSWSMPRFSFSKPNIKSPEVDVKFEAPQVDLTIPEAQIEVNIPEVEVKEPSAGISVEDSTVAELEAKFKKPRFSLPRFSFSKQSVQAPEVDANLSEVGASLPEERVEVKEPGVEVKAPEAEIDIAGQGSKFKMPSLGISMPKVKGPDVDISLPKKDASKPETKAEVKLSGVEVKDPAVTISAPDTSTLQIDPKLKKPSFTLPRFSFSKQNVQAPDVDVNIPKVDVSLPEEKVEVEKPELDIKAPVTDLEIDGQGSKFKMPKFGISLPKVKGPEIDFSLSKKDADVTIPEAKTEVKPPDLELKSPSAKVEVEAPVIDVQVKNVEDSPSKFKMPTFKLPKFGTTLPSVAVEVPEVEKEINIEGAQLNIPNVGAAVDVTLPEVKADVKLPDVEVKGPSGSISIEELPAAELDAKLKKPRFSLPKFSFSKQTVPVPEVDVSIPDAGVTVPEAKAELPDVKLEGPKVDVTPPEVPVVSLPGVAIKEHSGDISIEDSHVTELDAKLKKPRFSLPKFSFSKQSVQTPEVDVSVPKVDIHLAEGKVEVMKTEMDITAPESELEIEGQGSKFKMPSLGISMPKVKGPEIDLSLQKKDVGVTLPEAEVKFTENEAKDASASISLPDAPTLEDDNKGRKTWSMPRFSFSKPNIKGPDVNFEAPQIDITIPEAKPEVHIPEVEVKEPSADISIEDSPVAELDAKFKKPMFSLPKFSFSKQSVQAPEVDVSLPTVDVSLPEGKVEVKEPKMEMTAPETEVGVDGQGSTFKMPKFGISLPKIKAPEIDVGSSKVEVEVILPESRSEVILPNVETSAKVEVKTPETEVQAKPVEGSPSKFKMPTFKLPRFGAAIPDITAEVPEVKKENNIDGAEGKVHAVNIKFPEAKAPEVSDVEIKTPSTDISVPKATVVELDEKMKKPTFSLPRFSFSKSSIPSPEVDVKPLELNVSLPGGEVVIKQPEMEIKLPEHDVQVKNDVGSPSKFKMPTLHLPKFGVTSTVTDGVEFSVPQQGGIVDVASPEIKADVSLPEAEMKASSAAISVPEEPAVEIDTKMKKPRFSLPRFSFSKSSIQPPEDAVISPELNVSIPEEEVVVKQPEKEISPEIDVQMKTVLGSPSKFKMPTLHLPKFGVASSNDTVEVLGADKEINIDGATVDVTLPVSKAEVSLPEVHMTEPSAATSLQDAHLIDVDAKLKKTRFSLPKMSFSKQNSKDSEVDVKLSKVDVSPPEVRESELKIKTPEAEIEQKNVEGSPSRFKMPTLKLSKFGGAFPKLELKGTPDGDSNVDAECEDGHLEVEVEPQGPGKSPKLTLTSFGEILKSIDVEFDVAAKEQVDEKSDPYTAETPEKGKNIFKFPKLTFGQSPGEQGTAEDKKQSETKENESNVEQEPGKSPVKTGWLRFLSSPSESEKKIVEKELEREQNPTGDTGDDDMSTTYSIQSSDAFADISSTVMSEQVGMSLSSPTKVTVRLSDPNAMMGLGEMLSNIITSTTTELASVEPNLPEKVTILSSEASSSSLDTLKLESGKIHVVTSNIQATPEAQRTVPLTHFQAQSTGGISLQKETKEIGGKTMVVERHVMRQSSSESRETVVVTKQVTSVFGVDSSGPVSGHTASSIPRLKVRDTHSEKMKFFDGSKK